MPNLTAKRSLSLAAAGLAAATVLTACSSSKSNPLATPPASGATGGGTVTIASANFPESVLLAQIYGDVLKAKGAKVDYKLNIGSRELLYKQIQSGAFTLTPEYNGALLAYLDKSATAVKKDEVNTALAAKLPAGLEILDSAPAEDKDSLNVTKETAAKYSLTKISDLAPIAKDLVIGSAPEFNTRQQGILGLDSVYGLKFKEFKALDNSGPNTESALLHGDVQVADLYSTDPKVAANGFVTLKDDKDLFGAQNITPLAYKAGLTQTYADALNALSAKLDTTTLAGLVKEVVTDKKDSDTVAAAWVASVGLTK